jgi:adenylate cyclase
MRLPVRLPQYHPLQRWLAAAVIALVCSALGMLLWAPVRVLGVVGALDRALYDSLYRLHAPEDVTNGPIVIVAVDDESVEAVDRANKKGWPWPREYWGKMVSYVDAVGARAIVFDLIFDRTSVYDSPTNDDDRKFAEAVDASATPVVLATVARPDGSTWDVAPPVAEKVTGAANVSDEAVIRAYAPIVNGHPSLAVQALRRSGATPPAWADGDAPFLLRYYGPHAKDGRPVTFRYVRAANLLAAADDPEQAKDLGISPDLFKGKIVLIATITAATYDLKASPLSPRYPGVEIHATALQNLLSNQRVTPVSPPIRLIVLIGACLLAAIGTVIPARVPLKIVGGFAGVAVVIGVTTGLFMGDDVRWMPAAAATTAAMLTAFAGLAWSYLTEVRQRRFIFNALAQNTSREVAHELARDPRKLNPGGQRRDMTVMFTDLANFTALSEAMEVERLEAMLQLYLEEMSEVILAKNGYLDKYIGDAIMSFWNAPVSQTDHAVRACEAALEMRRREAALQPRLREMSGHEVHSRIGINSGPMVVGNMGSPFKFSYTVLGDAVNLASRLEGANKLYGTRVLLSETTANLVKDRFALRKIDLLRVKGKRQPMAVYELLDDDPTDGRWADLVSRYERALAAFQAQHFDTALKILDALNRDYPGDGPTVTLLSRARQFRDEPPAPDWDGVYVAKDK